MKITAFAFGLFFAAFLLHWIVWRIRIPQRQTRALLLILLGTLPVGLGAMVLLAPGELGPWQCLQIATFHIAMSLAYCVVYYGLEERSPSMTILAFVADSGNRGRSREELDAILFGVNPVEVRLDGMVRDKVAFVEEDRYHLTAKGRFWAKLFSTWLGLLGMEKGG